MCKVKAESQNCSVYLTLICKLLTKGNSLIKELSFVNSFKKLTLFSTFLMKDSNLCHLICQDEKNNMLLLRVARFMFDECYPNSPDGILAVEKKPQKKTLATSATSKVKDTNYVDSPNTKSH